MTKTLAIVMNSVLAGLVLGAGISVAGQSASSQTSPAHDQPSFTLETSVNRVLLDVVVTDANGHPVHGLTQADFTIEEDSRPQKILTFDVFDFDKGMDYVPPRNLPALPPDTFVNLPNSPERGPLYVLFYDLVNIPREDQVPARAQLVKFLRDKPVGARFAIFVSSDGVHLVCGFTSNREKLLAAVDAKGGPHVPEIFLMGANFGAGDSLAAATRLDKIASYLAPLPGRKNIIWFASQFPLSLFPNQGDENAYVQEARRTIDLFAAHQIALYPVDTSALPAAETYATPGSAGGNGITIDSRETHGKPKPSDPAKPGDPQATFKGPGASLTEESYITQDQVAELTGGRAIYSSNALTGALQKVTEDGGNYYTLTYSPSDKDLNGSFRHIEVRLKHDAGFRLAYRRGYYAVRPDNGPVNADGSITAAIEHGAPELHSLIFGAHVASSPVPVKEVSYTVDYTVMAHQLRSAGDLSPRFEIAVAAYDADGRLLNSVVNQAAENPSRDGAGTPAQDAYRMEQRLDAPLSARSLRFAIRELRTGKIGAMEIPLPLDRSEKHPLHP